MTQATERRLAAIMVADVAGFSRLMEHAETGTFARPRRLHDDVTQPALGERAASDAALAKLIADYGSDAPIQIAEVYAWRGEIDAAFDWLERGYSARDPGMTSLLGDPLLRGLHADPR